ncbi:hypothetical protein BJ878DRAFT_151018 [Calycina marina]|uniref:Filamentation protein n=1 Tax=Calycina marina TaxID=1763456 RepID=A0A9P7ZBK6_9HELO|nr:hypothetical protein BJ878DRAFT_151018 [Calycina marina]
MSLQGRDASKGTRYVQQLNEARFRGMWETVPNLLHKVRKHAPTRTCLVITVEAEHAITKASGGPHLSELTIYVSRLQEAIEKERTYQEDEFQARVCLAWLLWEQDKYGEAINQFPASIEQEFVQLDGTESESSSWTKVCAIKAAYIKGSSQLKVGAIKEALETYDSALPIFAVTSSRINSGKELETWTELYLTAFCMLSSFLMKSDETPIREAETLSAFRGWSTYWHHRSSPPIGGFAHNSKISRGQVWKAYYGTLSEILQKQLPFPTTALITTHTTLSTRLEQWQELRDVESKYEAILLSTMPFPRADDVGDEVELFVELVIGNWRVVCGGGWAEHDLGEGGTEKVSRGVLNILYRAATKTFHSTPILRHLFTLHLALAEFDLALKAFDTYLDIVKRGKARVEKTGDQEPGLDNDEIVLRTVSECIRALCRYGSFDGAEKANDLGHFFEGWLDNHYPVGKEAKTGCKDSSEVFVVGPKVLAVAWRSIGIAYANWARFTFNGTTRGDIQQQAMSCLRKALHPSLKASKDVCTLFALGTILAERRELPVAMEVVKAALLPQTSRDSDLPRFARERSLIPLWHLMALLLSASQEFLSAAKSCEGAFEQFQNPQNLFGNDEHFKSEHLQVYSKLVSKSLGIVDEMNDFEKENLLEVKITQLTLIETLEGPEAAINASDELLNLYSRLFGPPLIHTATVPPSNTGLQPPPKSSAGTLRSIKGSIFGRSGGAALKPHTDSGLSAVALHPPTTQTIPAPKIEVTGANGRTASQHHRLQKEIFTEKANTRSVSLSREKAQEPSSSTKCQQPSMPPPPVTRLDGEEYFKPTGEHDKKWPDDGNANGHTDMEQGFSSLTTPVTHFPKNQQRRWRASMLIKLWLLIAGFYRRAALYEDGKGAIEEAEKLVLSLDRDVSMDTSGNISVTNPGWGSGKSVAELWADVFAEHGYLAVAMSLPFEALAHFESALTHFQDHPSAIVGLSNILLDIYSEDLLPPPSIPSLALPTSSTVNIPATSAHATPLSSMPSTKPGPPKLFPLSLNARHTHGPLGIAAPAAKKLSSQPEFPPESSDHPHKEPSTAMQDRIAARDRASFLLSTLTKLGKGWNYSEAWFSLARSYELQGQPGKAKEVLWWCVELEESRPTRDWSEIGRGGYVL